MPTAYHLSGQVAAARDNRRDDTAQLADLGPITTDAPRVRPALYTRRMARRTRRNG